MMTIIPMAGKKEKGFKNARKNVFILCIPRFVLITSFITSAGENVKHEEGKNIRQADCFIICFENFVSFRIFHIRAGIAKDCCNFGESMLEFHMVKSSQESNGLRRCFFYLFLIILDKAQGRRCGMKKNNIILIGMPGAGKSTIGVVLAKIIGYHFIDSDLVIQERENRLLHEIIAAEGREGFLRIENEINASIEAERSIIATGGSVVYGQEAMEHFRRIGEVVYLKADYWTIEKRLGNLEKRGVVLSQGQTLQMLYDERCALYEKYADITVDEKGLGTEETIGEVLRGLKLLNES